MESITKFLDPHIVPEVTGDDLDVDKALSSKNDLDVDSDTIEVNITNNTQEKPKVSDVKLPAKKESNLADLVDDSNSEDSEDKSASSEDSGSEENQETSDSKDTETKETEKPSETEKPAETEKQEEKPAAAETSSDTETAEKESVDDKDEENTTDPENTDAVESATDIDAGSEGAETEPEISDTDDVELDTSEPNPEVDHGESDLDVDPQQPAPLLKLVSEYDFYSTKIYETPNGSQIVYINKPSELCYCAFDFKVGSFYEDDSNRGISHLLEHLMFNGYPGMSSLEFNEKLDKLGMSINAFTDIMLTSYYFSGLKANFIPAFDLYANLIKSFTPTQEILDKERGVVINEIGVRNDNNWNVLHETINAQAYSQHPIANPVIGYEDVIRNISVDQVKEWYTKNYNAKNLTLFLVGDFPEEDLVFIGDKLQLFADGEKNINPVITDTMVMPMYRNVITHKEGAIQTLIDSSMVFKNEAYNYYDLEILVNILGATMSSYLWDQFREKRSLAYQVSAYSSAMDPEHLTIHLYAGLNDSEDAELAKSIFKDAFQYAKAVSEDDFNKGLNIQIAELYKNEETEEGLLGLVRAVLYFGFVLDDFISSSKNITYDSYQTFVEQIDPENMVTGILYPL